MGKFRGLDTDEGWINRRFANLQRQITEQAAARRLVIHVDRVESSQNLPYTAPSAIPAGWTNYLVQTLNVPKGYTHATVMVRAGATGRTFFEPPQLATVHVSPHVAGIQGPVQSLGAYSTGTAGPVVWSCVSARFAVATSFQMWVSARSDGPLINASVHLAAEVIYTRG